MCGREMTRKQRPNAWEVGPRSGLILRCPGSTDFEQRARRFAHSTLAPANCSEHGTYATRIPQNLITLSSAGQIVSPAIDVRTAAINAISLSRAASR
jgi:hypothetical protein